MTKKLSKVLSILLISLMILTIASNFVSAYDPDSITPNQEFDGSDKITSLGGKIVGAIQIVGSIIAIAVLVVLGIKYMMGSAEEKAEYKKTMIPYLVGAVIVFAASNLAKIIFDFASNNITA